MKLKAPEEFRSGPLLKADQKVSKIKQSPLIGSLWHLWRESFQKSTLDDDTQKISNVVYLEYQQLKSDYHSM